MKFIDPIKLLSKIEFDKCGNIITTMRGLRLAMGKSEVEAEPVKHGRWVDRKFEDGEWYHTCSVCGMVLREYAFDNFCGNCGAKMDADIADMLYSPKCPHNIEAEEGEER